MAVRRKTKSVQTVLKLFHNSHNAFSVVDLVEKFDGQMNKTTVYRILERLESEGLVHSFTDSQGLKWYAKCQDCTAHQHDDIHPHFQCKSCGKVVCLPDDYKSPELPNYQIEHVEVLITGYCPDCK